MAADTDTTPVTRQPILGGVTGLFGAVIVVALAGIHFSDAAQFVPFAASLVLFGLPHGALDHLIASRLAGVPLTRTAVLRVVALYGVLGAFVVGFWFVAPAVAAIAFIALTWFHWGQGDLFALLTFTRADYLNTRFLRVLACVVRGGLPMLVPYEAWPQVYRHVLVGAAGLFSAPAASSLGWLDAPLPRLSVGLLFAVVTIGYFLLALRHSTRQNRRSLAVDAAETALLTLFFVSVPPILAVGLYFCLWHALRHILRLGQLTKAAHPFRAFARDALPITVISLLFLAAVFVAVPRSHGSPDALLGLYLVALSALTLPHVVIVSGMDTRQNVWL